MSTGSKTTSLEEQENTVNGYSAFGGETLVEYTVFLSDSFGRNPSSNNERANFKFLDSNSVPNQIDGYSNDDSYRKTRHHLRNYASKQAVEQLAVQAAAGAGAGVAATAAAAASISAAATATKFSSGLMNYLRENSLARQLQSKREQPAIIRLVQRPTPGLPPSGKDPKETDTTDGGRNRKPWVNLIPPNTKFFLESVTENREEKVQIIDTFGEFVAFFFGARPEVYTYQGTLLNSMNHNWKNEFMMNYEHFLRGSQAVKNRATIFLQYDDVIVEGFMLNSQIRQVATDEHAVPFQFNLLILNRSPLNPMNMLYLRNATQRLTTLESALFSSLQEAQAVAHESPEKTEMFLILREWLNNTRTPSAGNMIHRTNTNQVEPERTEQIGDFPQQDSSFNDVFAEETGEATA